jgi:hypothetical protein
MIDDPRYRESDRLRQEETLLTQLFDNAVRKVTTGVVIAGGLIGLGAYFSGDRNEAPRYQVTTANDGRIIRLNTDSGSIVVCQDNRCWVMQRGSNALDDEPPPRADLPKQQAQPALPAPAPDNAAAAAPATGR